MYFSQNLCGMFAKDEDEILSQGLLEFDSYSHLV